MISRSASNKLTLVLAVLGTVIATVLLVEHFAPTTDLGCKAVGGDCNAASASNYGHLGPIPTAAIGLAMYVVLAGLTIARGIRLKHANAAPTVRESLSNAATQELAQFSPSTDAPEGQAVDGTADLDDAPVSATQSLNFRSAFVSPENIEALPPASVYALDRLIWGLTLLAFIISWSLQYVSLFKLHVFCPWCVASACTITLAFLLATLDFVVMARRLNGEQKLLIGVSGFILVLLAFVYLPVIIADFPAKSTGPVKDIGMDRAVLITPTMAIKGNTKAPYLIIEFADYQCPHCKVVAKELDKVLLKYSNKIRGAFRNYPLVQHRHAREAAIAALAAGKQGKYWQMHDLIFERQKDMEEADFTVANFDDYARTLHLDMAKFDVDEKEASLRQQLDEDVAAGQTQGIIQTPTFYFLTPTQIWRYTSFPELTKRLDDSHDSIWK